LRWHSKLAQSVKQIESQPKKETNIIARFIHNVQILAASPGELPKVRIQPEHYGQVGNIKVPRNIQTRY